MEMASHRADGFAALLHADGPASGLEDGLGLYGWLVGSWHMDVVRRMPDGRTVGSDGEIHFGWVLGGTAIQDVWMTPARTSGQTPQMFGTTLRVYDPGIDAWHIVWTDPVRQVHSRQTGRAVGDAIVQEGADAAGIRNRWTFRDIRADGFHWIGEHAPDGEWSRTVEFFARRTG